MRRILSLVMVAAMASVSSAAITGISILSSTPTADGVVNVLGITFDGQYSGSQMIVNQDVGPGGIFQHANGTETPPSQAFVDIIPALGNDTFTAQGGTRSESTDGSIALGGGAVNLGGNPVAVFDDNAINQSWNPSPGVVITDQADYVTAQVTLSPNANGSFSYLGSADSAFGVVAPEPGAEAGGLYVGHGVIEGGVMSIIPVPEPATISIAALALLGLVGLRRRNG